MRLRPRSDAPVFSVLQDRDFRAIWYVGTLRELSRRMELLVLSWLILQATQSPLQLGLVLVFNNLPRPVLSFFTGFIADRFNRWRILMASQIINTLVAAVILALIVTDTIAAWHVYAAVFLQGATKSLEDPVPSHRHSGHRRRAPAGERPVPGHHQQHLRQDVGAVAGRHND